MVKLLIFCCLIALAFAARTKQTNRKTNSYIAKALLLPSSSYNSPVQGPEGACADACVAADDAAVDSDSELREYKQHGNDGFRFEGHFGPVVDKVCTTYNTSSACLERCPSSEAKERAIADNVVAAYMCHNPKFREFQPCFDRVNKQMITECNNKCASQKAAAQTLLNSDLQTLEDVTNLLTKCCKYQICDANCAQPKVIQECGTEAAGVLQGYMRSMANTMKTGMARMGLEMPAVCNNWGRSDD